MLTIENAIKQGLLNKEEFHEAEKIAYKTKNRIKKGTLTGWVYGEGDDLRVEIIEIPYWVKVNQIIDITHIEWVDYKC